MNAPVDSGRPTGAKCSTGAGRVIGTGPVHRFPMGVPAAVVLAWGRPLRIPISPPSPPLLLIMWNVPAPVTPVHRPGTSMIIWMPDHYVIVVPLSRRLMPPIRWARMRLIPDNDIAVVPIKIAVQPIADREPTPKLTKGEP